jgi:cellulose synthase/poly-beta-1,6-N-acetylglucosamine synthase-like glycosyltransferase
MDWLLSFSEYLHGDAALVHIFCWAILGMGLMQNLISLIQLPAAAFELREHSQNGDTESAFQFLISDVTLPISIIVPAHNEELTIVNNVRSLLSLHYSEIEIIVVNDGSNDATLKILVDTFQLRPVVRAYEPTLKHARIRNLYGSPDYPSLLVVDKENIGCKADASNAGINFSRNKIFCVIDADSMIEEAALLSAVRPFMEDPKNMIAVGGTVRVINGCKVRGGKIVKMKLPRNMLALMQCLEYIRAFLVARLAWSRWGMLNLVSGAFGIFRRDIALEVGGFSTNTVGEDYDLITKMHRYMLDNNRPYAMRYVPEPVCWTEVPESIQALGRQRMRWHRGAVEVFFSNIGILLNPKYGRFGMVLATNNLIIDIIGPFLEVFGYVLLPFAWASGIINADFALVYIMLFFMLGVFF